MLENPQKLLDLVVMILVFGLISAVWLAGVVLWLRHRAWRTRHVEKRLGIEDLGSGDQRVLRLWKDGREKTTTVPNRGRPLFERIEDACHRAGWEIPAANLVFSVLSLSTLLFVTLLLVTDNLMLAGGIVAVTLVVLHLWMQHRIARRMLLFESQLIDGLELAARSLRAGHPLAGSFRLIADEIKPPVGAVFTDICQRQAMGVALEDSLRVASLRAGSGDLSLFAASVIIQIRSGGNLADMMDRLAWVIRDRRRLNSRLRVLTAQTQLSKRILIAMPIGMFFLLNVLNPAYMEPLYGSHGGRIMLAVAASGLVLGGWIMNRMAVLKH